VEQESKVRFPKRTQSSAAQVKNPPSQICISRTRDSRGENALAQGIKPKRRQEKGCDDDCTCKETMEGSTEKMGGMSLGEDEEEELEDHERSR
jgi:hypothetical protein